MHRFRIQIHYLSNDNNFQLKQLKDFFETPWFDEKTLLYSRQNSTHTNALFGLNFCLAQQFRVGTVQHHIQKLV